MTHVPYGYRIEDARAVIYEPEAQKVRSFFEEYKACKSMRAAGIKVGIDKTHSVLVRMLKNKTYLGTDFYPAIIDQKTFDEAQDIRIQNAKDQNRIREYKPQVTAECNSKFVAAAVEIKYEDPYQQAAYAYGFIQEAVNE